MRVRVEEMIIWRLPQCANGRKRCRGNGKGKERREGLSTLRWMPHKGKTLEVRRRAGGKAQTLATLRLTEHVTYQTRTTLEVFYDERGLLNTLELPARAACPL